MAVDDRPTHQPGDDAGECPLCHNLMVWRQSKKGELYKGCTNFDGGCRYNTRSH